MNILGIYLIAVNILSGTLFMADKSAARKNNKRIPEATLHLLELSGGVFFNIILMYTIHHKNRKAKYWLWTWLILIIWIFFLLLKYHFIRI